MLTTRALPRFAAIALASGGLAVASSSGAHGQTGPPTQIELGGDLTPRQERGRAVVAQSGCEACHRFGANGNDGPGPDLTRIGRRLDTGELIRVLVKPSAPMPSFRPLQRRKPHDFRAMVAFLRALR